MIVLDDGRDLVRPAIIEAITTIYGASDDLIELDGADFAVRHPGMSAEYTRTANPYRPNTEGA